MKIKINNMIRYYGITKEEYQARKEDMRAENCKMAFIYSVFVSVLLMVLIIFVQNMNYRLIYVGGFIPAVILTVIIVTSKKNPQKQSIEFFYYLSLCAIMTCCIWDSTFMKPESRGALALVAFLLFPCLIVGKPLLFAGINIVGTTAFLLIAYRTKDISIFYDDLVNGLTFGVAGIGLHYIVGFLRLKGLINISKLETSDKLLEVALDSSNVRTWEYDVKKRRCTQNSRNENGELVQKIMVGMPESMINARQILPECYDDYRKLYRDIDDGCERTEKEIAYIQPNGVVTWALVRYVTIFNKEKEAVRAVGCAIDLSREKELQVEREAAERHLALVLSQEEQTEGVMVDRGLFNVTDNKVVEIDEKITHTFTRSRYAKQSTSIQEVMTELSSKIPDEVDRQRWLQLFDKERLLASYRFGKDRLTMEIKRYNFEGKMIWMRDIIRLNVDPVSGNLLALWQLYDINDNHKQKDIFNCVLQTNYDYIVYIESQTGNYEMFLDRFDENMQKYFPKTGNDFEGTLKTYLQSHGDNIALISGQKVYSLDEITKYLDENKYTEFLYRKTGKEGEILYKKLSFRYLLDEEKSILLTCEDVTQMLALEKKHREALAQALQDAQKANLEKNAFLSKISYGLRTSMNTISGFGELARETNNVELKNEYMKKVMLSANETLAFIQDTMDNDKIQNGELDYDRVNRYIEENQTDGVLINKDIENNDNLTDMNVLVCEDHTLNAELIRRLLEKRKMNVTVAANGEEGVEILKEAPEEFYEVVLMDLRMPVMDGLLATQKIRRLTSEKKAQIPIIAMTANAYVEDEAEAKKAGMNGYITKPIIPSVLFQTIEKVTRAE